MPIKNKDFIYAKYDFQTLQLIETADLKRRFQISTL